MKMIKKLTISTIGYCICVLLLLCSMYTQAQDKSKRYEVRAGAKIASSLQTLEIVYLQESLNTLDDEVTLNLYPNPTNNVVNINIGPGEVIKNVNFLNMSGVKMTVPQLQANGHSVIYNVANLATGIYILGIELESGKLLNKKIVKN